MARVLSLSEFKIITRILFPSVLPYMLTGIRLSIGTRLAGHRGGRDAHRWRRHRLLGVG